jgi:hypothetical protein
MITLNDGFTLEEVVKSKPNQGKLDSIDPDLLEEAVQVRTASATLKRPDVVDAKVYKVKSPFVKFSVYITLSYITENGKKRPVEIFINSKDLTHAAEYAVLTRLISAIFRKTNDVHFILEELRSIWDPSGGFFKGGKYVHSFYAEVADVIERFFIEEGIIKETKAEQIPIPIQTELKKKNREEPQMVNSQFKICPECNQKTLKTENGCDSCMQCGYTKCDK